MTNLPSLISYMVKLQGKSIVSVTTDRTTTLYLNIVQPISPTFCFSIISITNINSKLPYVHLFGH